MRVSSLVRLLVLSVHFILVVGDVPSHWLPWMPAAGTSPTTKGSSPSRTTALASSLSVDFSLGVLSQQKGTQSVTVEGMGDLQTGCPMLVAEVTQECPSLLPWVWNMLSGSFHRCTVMCYVP